MIPITTKVRIMIVTNMIITMNIPIQIVSEDFIDQFRIIAVLIIGIATIIMTHTTLIAESMYL